MLSNPGIRRSLVDSMASFPLVFVIAPTALEAATAAIMWHRKLWRKLPFFFSYLAYQCLWMVMLIPLSGSPRYHVVYWGGDVVSMSLGFAVIYELFANVVGDYEGIRDLGLMLYKWSAVALMFIAVVSVATTPSKEMQQWIDALLALERGVRIVQCGLLGFLFLFFYYLGLSWRKCTFGFALGFAIFVVSELVIVAARWHAGPAGKEMYYWLKPVSFDIATVIWAGYALQREPEQVPAFSIYDSQMASWNASVLQLLRRQWD